MKVTIEITDVEGKKAKLKLATDTPKLRTVNKEGVYTLEGLMTLASTGSLNSLDSDAKDANTALVDVTKEEASQMLADAYAAGSEYLKEAKATKDGE
jgi:hypothetical protein